MLMKNCNAFDFTHKQIFKTLTCDNLGGDPFKVGPVHLHTLHIPKATIEGNSVASVDSICWLENRIGPFTVSYSQGTSTNKCANTNLIWRNQNRNTDYYWVEIQIKKGEGGLNFMTPFWWCTPWDFCDIIKWSHKFG